MQDDLFDVATLIQRYVVKRGGFLSMSSSDLRRELNSYVKLRLSVGRFMLERVRPIRIPTGWTDHSERVWLDWISLTCDLESWDKEVIQPIFGTDVREWERDTEWRQEIFAYLDEWIQRDNKIVAKFDMTSEEEVEEELYGGLDPYMVENGLIKWT